MSYMEEPSAQVEKIANGWKLNLNWQEKDVKGETDYKDEEWMFATWEEAVEKAKKFFEDLEPKVGEQVTDEVSVDAQVAEQDANPA